MAALEIESFVTKYKHLCCVGIDATLLFECKDGETFVTFKANLGNSANIPSAPAQYRNAAYGRRQVRRQAARKSTQTSEAVEATVPKGVNIIKAEKPAEGRVHG